MKKLLLVGMCVFLFGACTRIPATVVMKHPETGHIITSEKNIAPALVPFFGVPYAVAKRQQQQDFIDSHKHLGYEIEWESNQGL